MNCKSNNCTELATHIVYWPGKETMMCSKHAENAIKVATAMGFFLSVKGLTTASTVNSDKL